MPYSMNKCDFTNIAFTAGTDSLEMLKGKITERFPALLPSRTQPKICSVFMLGSASFEVALSDGCVLTALELPSGKFAVDFGGCITELTFTAATTLDYIGVDWMTIGQ